MGVMPLFETLHWGALLGDVDCMLFSIYFLSLLISDENKIMSTSVLQNPTYPRIHYITFQEGIFLFVLVSMLVGDICL